jgi:hypothetical protein
MIVPQTHYGYGAQVGRSPEGYPIYLYTDPHTRALRYVVVLPNGQAYFSDANGKVGPPASDANVGVATALLGGILGFVFGGGSGAVLGAIAGAVAANELTKRRAA